MRSGAHRANAHSAASASEPVRSLTRTPATSHIADEPRPETTTAARYGPASRSPRTRPVRQVVRVVGVDVMAGDRGAKDPPSGSGGCPGNRRREGWARASDEFSGRRGST